MSNYKTMYQSCDNRNYKNLNILNKNICLKFTDIYLCR